MESIKKLQLELSIKCNSNCAACPRSKFNRSGKPGFMSFELARKLIDEAYGLGARLLIPRWLGDPTLSPDYERIVEYAKD